VWRRIKEPRFGAGDTPLVPLAGFQQGEPLHCGEVARSHFYRDQHAPVPTPLSIGFAALPSLLALLLIC
jgi:hypothetical protein